MATYQVFLESGPLKFMARKAGHDKDDVLSALSSNEEEEFSGFEPLEPERLDKQSNNPPSAAKTKVSRTGKGKVNKARGAAAATSAQRAPINTQIQASASVSAFDIDKLTESDIAKLRSLFFPEGTLEHMKIRTQDYR